MTLTFLDLYNECAGQPWSMYDADAESVDDLETALKISVNKAVSYLWNFQAWSFRIAETTIKTKANKAYYSMPNGNIQKKVISGVTKYSIKYNGTSLEYLQDYEEQDEAAGEPEYFYIEKDYIYIYPTPDAAYTINVKYLKIPIGYDEDGNAIYELTNETDYIDIPEKYEKLFKNCIISLAMIYAIADESDENHSGYEKQYEDSLAILLKYCKNGLMDKSLVW